MRTYATIEYLGLWETLHNPEFKRLKTEEQQRLSLDWNLQRTLAKINCRIHTDAIKEQVIPPKIIKEQADFIYPSEADLLNVALFGQTAAQWRETNPSAKGNIRDEATLEQLVVLSNLESINAVLIPVNKTLEFTIDLESIIIDSKSIMKARCIKCNIERTKETANNFPS